MLALPAAVTRIVADRPGEYVWQRPILSDDRDDAPRHRRLNTRKTAAIVRPLRFPPARAKEPDAALAADDGRDAISARGCIITPATTRRSGRARTLRLPTCWTSSPR